jgi:hypothetical protein
MQRRSGRAEQQRRGARERESSFFLNTHVLSRIVPIFSIFLSRYSLFPEGEGREGRGGEGRGRGGEGGEGNGGLGLKKF